MSMAASRRVTPVVPVSYAARAVVGASTMHFSKHDYFKNPGDWVIVHTVIPEIMSSPMRIERVRAFHAEFRRSPMHIIK
jgi:hypothetical protein